MTLTVATIGDDIYLELIEKELIVPTLAWALNAAALSLLYESEINPTHAPHITLLLDGKSTKSYVESIGVTLQEVDSAILLLSDSDQEDVEETEYFVYLYRNSENKWALAKTVIVDINDGEEPGFRSLTLKDQLGFFFS